MTDEMCTKKNELALKEHIYEPKYGGKDHSGYETLMKYEVNYEREEAFHNGFGACYDLMNAGMDDLQQTYDNTLLLFQSMQKERDAVLTEVHTRKNAYEEIYRGHAQLKTERDRWREHAIRLVEALEFYCKDPIDITTGAAKALAAHKEMLKVPSTGSDRA